MNKYEARLAELEAELAALRAGTPLSPERQQQLLGGAVYRAAQAVARAQKRAGRRQQALADAAEVDRLWAQVMERVPDASIYVTFSGAFQARNLPGWDGWARSTRLEVARAAADLLEIPR